MASTPTADVTTVSRVSLSEDGDPCELLRGVQQPVASVASPVVSDSAETNPASNGGITTVAFTSPSTVHHFMETTREQDLGHLNFVCMGPITAEAAIAAGLSVAVTAQISTTEGLVQSMLQYYEGR